MVERFYHSDDEEFPFDDEDIGDADTTAYVDQDGLLEVMHMDLAQSELNQLLLEKAIALAEKSFFWRFRSTKSKMTEIGSIYKQLLSMTEQQEKDKDGT